MQEICRLKDIGGSHVHVHVHVHVYLPSRQDAQPPVPWRHTVEGADKNGERWGEPGQSSQVKSSQVKSVNMGLGSFH